MFWHWGCYILVVPGLMRKSWCTSEFENCPVSRTRSRIARYSSKNHDSKRLNKKENRKDCFQLDPKTEIVKSINVHTEPCWKYAVRRCSSVSVCMRLVYQRTMVQFPNPPAWMRGICNSTSRALSVVFRHLLALQVLLWDVCKQKPLTYNQK